MIEVLEKIKDRLTNVLKTTYVDVIDKSPLHAGHYENQTNLPSHLHIIIASPILNEVSKVDAHRKIYDQLKDEFAQGLHAVSIEIKSS